MRTRNQEKGQNRDNWDTGQNAQQRTDLFGGDEQTESRAGYRPTRDLFRLGDLERHHLVAVISRAKLACEIPVHAMANHFVDVNEIVNHGSGSKRKIENQILIRSACYLIAQRGDSKKSLNHPDTLDS